MHLGVYYLVYAGFLGAAVGSFTNVLALRLNTGRTLGGRSFCPSCGYKLAWYDLFPVLSFAFLRGACRYCRAKISWQYPLVELASAALYIFATQELLAAPLSNVSIVRFAVLLLVIPLLIAIVVYDIRHKIIPDVLVYAFAAVSAVPRAVDIVQSGLTNPVLLDIAAGPVLFLPFFLFWFLSRGRVMGLGDAKLSVGIGLLLGLYGGLSAVLFGFWAGALYGIAAIALSRARGKSGAQGVTLKSEVPFAPFLILGVLAVEFFGFSLRIFGL